MELKNVSILKIMAPNLAADPNIKKVAEAFDEALRDIIKKIPEVEVIPNLVLDKIVNETLIDLLAWQFHVDFYEPDMSLEVKRELVMKSLDWHYRKGTPSVVEEIVSTVFSKAIIEEWFEYGGLPYRFRIATDEQIPNEEVRNKLYRAINSVKNTRSFLDSITQLVFYIDRVLMKERHKMEVKMPLYTDNFASAGRLRRNGRFKRDGTFVNTELETFGVERNADFLRNANFVRNDNYRRVASSDIITPPFRRNTWEREKFFLNFDFGVFTEKQFAQALRNTSLKRDSGIVRDGYSDKFIDDRFNETNVNVAVAESVTENERDEICIEADISETLTKRRNKTICRDASTYRGDKSIGERARINMALEKTTDTVSTTETFRIWYMKHHFRNTVFTRNDGKLLRDSMTLIPLE